MQGNQIVVLAGTSAMLMLVIVVILVSMITAPTPPRDFEIQQALDWYAFSEGLCPPYSELNIDPNGTWSCSPK